MSDSGPAFGDKFWDTSLTTRYGLADWATLSAELGFGDDWFGDDGTRVTAVGAGVQIAVWRRGNWAVHPGAYLRRSFTLWPDDSRCNTSDESVFGTLVGQWSQRVHGHDVAVWGGPGYFGYWANREPSARCTYRLFSPRRSFGLILGSSLILFDHVQLSYSFVYVDHYQPRVNISYRF